VTGAARHRQTPSLIELLCINARPQKQQKRHGRSKHNIILHLPLALSVAPPPSSSSSSSSSSSLVIASSSSPSALSEASQSSASSRAPLMPRLSKKPANVMPPKMPKASASPLGRRRVEAVKREPEMKGPTARPAADSVCASPLSVPRTEWFGAEFVICERSQSTISHVSIGECQSEHIPAAKRS